MKILLANPPGPWLRCRWDITIHDFSMKYFPFPVRLAYATAVLKKNGYDAHIVDSTAEELDRKDFIERFKKIDPNILIWETTASSFDYDLKTIEMIKKIKPGLITVASGYHATPTPKEHLKQGYNYVIVGECDYSSSDLIKYLDGKLKKFPKGVAAKGHKFVPRELIKNLDELPWPEREELPMKKYNDPKLNGFNVVLVSSRGCPRGCSFCTVPVYYLKPNYRTRNPKDVVDEMEYLWEKYKPNELYFDDDSFAINEKHAGGICNEIVKRKLKLKWNCMVDAKVSNELLELMKKAGCTGVTIGAESADPNVLKHFGKPITREDIIRFAETCRKFKLRSHVCWVLGLPYSTKESDLNTIKFALELPSDTLQFSICVPFPGTKMYKWCKRKGYLAVNDWRKIKGNDKSITNLPSYSCKEVEELLSYAEKQWHKKLLFKKPKIILFHLYNLYKYYGLKGIVGVPLKVLRTMIE